MTRLAVLSLHTSPLSLPGNGDAGGMNVYIRQLAASLAQTGVEATVFVRRHNDAPTVVRVKPGFTVVHIDAGAVDLPKESLLGAVGQFTEGVKSWLAENPADVLHANYWLSGLSGHRLKHELELPLVCTFHTLARAKSESGDIEPQHRIEAEADLIACSDIITAHSVVEAQQLTQLYDADPKRINVVPPGVDTAIFSRGARRGARMALKLDDRPLLLFVGRIQPLKGLNVATETLIRLRCTHPDARLAIIGGASGPDGERELRKLNAVVRAHRLEGQVSVIAPLPHHLLSVYYRAADVCLVPSRSESFGLVALEASACGVPVVAADVGGLRTLVDHGHTGYLIPDRDPVLYSEAVRSILDDRSLAASMGRHGAEIAGHYSWDSTANRMRKIFDDLSNRIPQPCTA